MNEYVSDNCKIEDVKLLTDFICIVKEISVFLKLGFVSLTIILGLVEYFHLSSYINAFIIFYSILTIPMGFCDMILSYCKKISNVHLGKMLNGLVSFDEASDFKSTTEELKNELIINQKLVCFYSTPIIIQLLYICTL